MSEEPVVNVGPVASWDCPGLGRTECAHAPNVVFLAVDVAELNHAGGRNVGQRVPQVVGVK